jgi:hypothetical protein
MLSLMRIHALALDGGPRHWSRVAARRWRPSCRLESAPIALGGGYTCLWLICQPAWRRTCSRPVLWRTRAPARADASAAAFGLSLGTCSNTWTDESHSCDTPAVHWRQNRSVRTPRRVAVGRPYSLFRMISGKHVLIQHQISHHLLVLAILVLELAETPEFCHAHPREFQLSAIASLLTDPHLALDPNR